MTPRDKKLLRRRAIAVLGFIIVFLCFVVAGADW